MLLWYEKMYWYVVFLHKNLYDSKEEADFLGLPCLVHKYFGMEGYYVEDCSYNAVLFILEPPLYFVAKKKTLPFLWKCPHKPTLFYLSANLQLYNIPLLFPYNRGQEPLSNSSYKLSSFSSLNHSYCPYQK